MSNFRNKFLIFVLGFFIFFLFFTLDLIINPLYFNYKKRYKDKNVKYSYEIYYTDDQILRKLSRKFDIYEEKEKVPEIIKNGFIASEDRRFLNHDGIDLIGLSRALYRNFQSGYIKEGGSTITQQVSRIIFLNNNLTFNRKIKELIIAMIIDRKYSKNQILKMYLNNIYLGEGSYGINEAASIYFGKLINELSLSEVAMIVGLAPAPSLYSPYENLPLAINRRNKVLRAMFLNKYIDKNQYKNALLEKINLFYEPKNQNIIIEKLLIDYILNEADNKINSKRIRLIDDQYKIKTTLNKDFQREAQNISKFNLPENIELALITIDSDTGYINAMMTSRNPNTNEFNRVTDAIRPLGSTFKIIPYSLAIIEGKSLKEKFNDNPTCWEDYCPKNFSNKYEGKISLIEAFKNSSNIVSIKLSKNIGLNKIIKFSNLFGLGKKHKLEEFLPLAIGAYSDSLINITNVYSAINNKGKFITPIIVKSIENKNGDFIWVNEVSTTRLINEKSTKLINNILEKSISNGNGIAASIPGEKIFGKTGTSDKNRDLWFIGSIKNLTTGIWLGYDDNRPTNLSSGDAANLWKIYIKNIIKKSN